MVFLKVPKFKTGITPSKANQFDLNNLTGTQKIQLAGSRIFGYTIGGNKSSGAKVLQKNLQMKKVHQSMYQIPIWDVSWAYPWISYEYEKQRFRMLTDKRKMRILMRGVKIGKKKGGEKVSVTEVFGKSG
ncbi:hypothetical protein PPERSA_00632 [Pseudocohnilembus persalinus]|uniref:Uncharacterized protein n=1 Tax=Pseudocohnilembus persalinus TaxID=266149 RepID=A0A0V0QSL3_PSEPJ|nr:hypothetical protein PPERSA_00632 [Pseudocohnilembus persalinus]|eukprot:KRX05331.1 hypothetical protein PPERSA_00632 [Pseudocohnilembus persalinus]